jgi:hypothetical protein
MPVPTGAATLVRDVHKFSRSETRTKARNTGELSRVRPFGWAVLGLDESELLHVVLNVVRSNPSRVAGRPANNSITLLQWRI